jgi:hypothetical protein
MNNLLIKNKTGGTLTNWIFVIAGVLLFLVILQSQILDPMNEKYSKDFQTGLDTSSLDELTSLKDTSDTTIEGAEAESTADGLTLKDAWTIGKSTYKTITSIISGTFISNILTDIMGFPPVVAKVLVVLIWLSLIMIIIYIFMKVVP